METISQQARSMVGLIAGTPVHTDRGLKRIEAIKVGDRVLSQGDEGGEQTYRAVTNTFVRDDREVCVVKFSTTDPNVLRPDDAMHHLYVTENTPLWVEGAGWISARNIKHDQMFSRANGGVGWVQHVWPVVRTPMSGVGWVSVDILGKYDGLEYAHIVDFRNGCNLWQYPRRDDNKAGVPYREGLCFGELEGYFDSSDFCDIFEGDDPFFKTRVFSLEVEGYGGYCAGEPGVVVKSCRTPSNPSIQDQIDSGKKFFAMLDFQQAAEQFAVAADGAEALSLPDLASEAWKLHADALQRSHQFERAHGAAQHAMHHARTATNRSLLASAQLAVAEALRAMNRADEAVQALDAAIIEARAGGNQRAEGRALYFQALMHEDAGRYQQCLACAEAAVIASAAAGDRMIADNALERKANALKQLHRHDEALAAFIEAHERCKEDQNDMLAALALAGKAETLYLLGRFADARGVVDEALQVANRADNIIATASVLITKAELLEKLAPDGCEVEFLKAYDLADKAECGDIRTRAKSGLVRTLKNGRVEDDAAFADSPLLKEGAKAFGEGNYELSLARFTKAFSQAEAIGNETLATKASIGRSNALRRLARREECLAAVEVAAFKAEKSGDRHLLAAAYLAKVRALWMSSASDAIAACDAALHQCRECNDLHQSAEALVAKAELLRMSNEHQQASPLYDLALCDAASSHNLGAAALSCFGKGSLCYVAYQSDEALEYYDVASILAEGVGDRHMAAFVHHSKGLALQQTNRFREALVEYQLALKNARTGGNHALVDAALDSIGKCEEILRS
ncbi:MAG: polymorphic toxin-type HINT domain-containing protein [Sulfuritalea sp.]|nr:polymorphic toxin-type HINT domain-containing protein [Sulfuritalea sp.]MDP1985028.1 polymorphic toxin-type HINT domain-containing protein [Sulfuritalea sp.]